VTVGDRGPDHLPPTKKPQRGKGAFRGLPGERLRLRQSLVVLERGAGLLLVQRV